MRHLSKVPAALAVSVLWCGNAWAAPNADEPAKEGQPPVGQAQPPAEQGQPPAEEQGSEGDDPDYAGLGEENFNAGNYAAAMRDWKHALVDDPENGGLMLMLSQTLLALGQYDQAAGATEVAMRMLPPEKWGLVVGNYKELYGNLQHYTDQIKALEKARDAKPKDPGLHFLLGFHFGYLGFPKQAVSELDKAIKLNPKDEQAKKLREVFAAKLEGAAAPPSTAPDDSGK